MPTIRIGETVQVWDSDDSAWRPGWIYAVDDADVATVLYPRGDGLASRANVRKAEVDEIPTEYKWRPIQ